MAWGVFLLLTSGSNAGAQTRNCPIQKDQTVTVPSGGVAHFKLDVTNADDARISIFQYPLDGILEQSTGSPLEFTFISQPEFNGSSVFTYRLDPPPGCENGTVLGKVTLVGGSALGTASGIQQEVKHEPTPLETFVTTFIAASKANPCGLGAVLPLTLTGALLFVAQRTRRR